MSKIGCVNYARFPKSGHKYRFHRRTMSKHWSTQEPAALMMLNVLISLMRDVIGQNFTTKDIILRV